ncbi:MAG TPA: hypothetical protein VGR56_02995 [Nitrososphaerales archaeon]|nr:hypothetical protein [Nitrososphaerales archaeon]
MNLKIVGILLYWCEGSKRERDRRVEFVNSDPKMIAVFMKYLRTKDIDEERIRVRMMLHRQDDELQCRNFWKKVTSLDDSNFISTVVKKTSLVRHPLPHGTITIRYNSLELLRLINCEIRELIERI